MQDSISTAVQQGGSLFSAWFHCVLYPPLKKPSKKETLFNIIGFSLLSHRARICLGMLQALQIVSFRAAVQAPLHVILYQNSECGVLAS